jgi:NAD(P)-dependent dehydrogenase (short-subunit alcohol dehydrogenase family)
VSSALESKVALVTGGASGIGAGSVRRLAAEGAHVVVADVSADAGRALADDVGGTFVHLDVSDPDAWNEVVATAEQSLGGIDVAHLNAGIAGGEYPVEIERVSDTDYRRLTGVNADGVFFGIRSLVPVMAARGGGAIVATSSLAGIGPHADDPVYAATKHFVIGLVRSLVRPLGAQGITINAVCPGGVDTALLEDIGRRDTFGGPDRPLMDPDEIAKAVVTLATGDESGATVVVVHGRPPLHYEFRGVPGMRTQ